VVRQKQGRDRRTQAFYALKVKFTLTSKKARFDKNVGLLKSATLITALVLWVIGRDEFNADKFTATTVTLIMDRCRCGCDPHIRTFVVDLISFVKCQKS